MLTDPVLADEVAVAIDDLKDRRAALCAMVPDMTRWIASVEASPSAIRHVPPAWLQVLHRCLDTPTSLAAQAADRRAAARAIEPVAAADTQAFPSTGHSADLAAMLADLRDVANELHKDGQRDAAEMTAAIESRLASGTPVTAEFVDDVVGRWCEQHRKYPPLPGSVVEDRLARLIGALTIDRLTGRLGTIDGDSQNIFDDLAAVGRLDVLNASPPLNHHALGVLLATPADVDQFADLLDAAGLDADCADGPAGYTRGGGHGDGYHPPLNALVWERIGRFDRVHDELQRAWPASSDWFHVADRVGDDTARAVLSALLEEGHLTEEMELPRLLALGERVGFDAATMASCMTGSLLVEFALTADPAVVREYLDAADEEQVTNLLEDLRYAVDGRPVRREVLLYGSGVPAALRDGLIDGAVVWQVAAERLGADTARWAVLWSLLGSWEGTIASLLDAVDACRAD
jgi:hypothetical protein